MNHSDTITALATPQGVGAIGVIRLSGKDSIAICNSVFRGKNLLEQKSHTIHYGYIADADLVLDEVMVSIFLAPKSFTTEDMVEIAGHGSPFILEQILKLLLKKGARLAKAGEFTMRAFLNGRIDLSQAEAVADLIASDSNAAQEMALKQMRGGFSNKLKTMRTELIDFAALLELELDFSEEDVEFANRQRLVQLVGNIQSELKPLLDSFNYGNALKKGVPVAIVGKPNAGKSTLLNALLSEERAIVSEIAGTTRDTIEEVLNLGGIAFRFIDTAGIRNTVDKVENIGVERAYEKIKEASIVLYLVDNTDADEQAIANFAKKIKDSNPSARLLLVLNKSDLITEKKHPHFSFSIPEQDTLYIAAKTGLGIDQLKEKLIKAIQETAPSGQEIIVTNLRHYEALKKSDEALQTVLEGIETGLTTDLIALNLKQALEYLGEIVGSVANEEILGSIFSKFCIGK